MRVGVGEGGEAQRTAVVTGFAEALRDFRQWDRFRGPALTITLQSHSNWATVSSVDRRLILGILKPSFSCPALLSSGRRKVLWHNMREEPVLYINGKPYVVREADKPFANLEYTGIDRRRVEDMEARLKQDVLEEVGGIWWGFV